MKPVVTERRVPVHTPGDVAVHFDGSVAVADMVLGQVRLLDTHGEWPQGDNSLPAPDVRSVVRDRDGSLIAACAFTGEIRTWSPGQSGSATVGLRLPYWLALTPDADPVVGGAADQQLWRVQTAVGPGTSRLQAMGWVCAGVLGGFAFADDGTIWVPCRPEPVVLAHSHRSKEPLRLRLRGAGELTGVCADPNRPGYMLLLDRTNRRIWRVSQHGAERAADLPRTYRRTRALRAHRTGRFAFSVVDPPSSSILWLDEALRVREVWRGFGATNRVTAESTAGTERASRLLDALGRSWLDAGGGGPIHALPGQARDIRILANQTTLLVLRDRHRVVWLDPKGRALSVFGCGGVLRYPCSADMSLERETVLVVDPLRARVVEFTLDGHVHEVHPLGRSYMRWLRCGLAGQVWIVDLADRLIMEYDQGWRVRRQIKIPPELDLPDLTSVEVIPPNGLTIGGPSVGRWAVWDERLVAMGPQHTWPS